MEELNKEMENLKSWLETLNRSLLTFYESRSLVDIREYDNWDGESAEVNEERAWNTLEFETSKAFFYSSHLLAWDSYSFRKLSVALNKLLILLWPGGLMAEELEKGKVSALNIRRRLRKLRKILKKQEKS